MNFAPEDAFWIMWRMPNGAKNYGKVTNHHWDKLCGLCPGENVIKVYYPTNAVNVVEPTNIQGAQPQVRMKLQPLLEIMECEKHFQYFNVSIFAGWQMVGNPNYIKLLDDMVAEYLQQMKEAPPRMGNTIEHK